MKFPPSVPVTNGHAQPGATLTDQDGATARAVKVSSFAIMIEYNSGQRIIMTREVARRRLTLVTGA